MTDQEKKYLADIREAIRKIEFFIRDTSTFEVYVQDIETQSAVERQLSIIGEAVNRFTRLGAPHTLESARQIAGFRNRLIHAYGSMDNTIVWAILKRHIPSLKEEAVKKLATK
ncbi:DUF86 domain-containing protein [Pontibacter saemangeumensis]|uniref:DUF86 domain-containing protein n=1 Tax=Pontibacter saemangeumensis TaxID=1084525 RepID=A0ABP8L652_9BACT